MWKLRLLAALLAALSTLVVAPAPAYACSCVSADVSEQVDPDDVVARGTIESRDVKGIPFPVLSSGDEVVYQVSVERVYQGSVGPVIEVHSVRSGASCGLEVDVGGDYLLVATQRDGELDANLCGGTGAASPEYLTEVEQALGPGSPPDRSIVVPDQPVSVAGWTAGGLGVVLLAGAGLWFLRRQTHNG